MDGYAVDSGGAVNEARVRLAEAPDALVLSSGPETIGLLRALGAGEVPRADCRLPVLVLGVDDDSAAVRCYRAGADGALPSESSGLLVAAGLKALVRSAGPQETRVVRVGGLTVDRDARTAQVENQPVKLTRLEFDLLVTLASEPRRTFTRAELTREVWGFDPAGGGTIAHRGRARTQAQTEARAGGRPADGADRPRCRLEAHPMRTLRAVSAGATRDRTVVVPVPGRSRRDTRVSRDRDGWPQIRLRASRSARQRRMISQMPDVPDHQQPGWSSNTAPYISTYLSSYTVVYTKAKEVW